MSDKTDVNRKRRKQVTVAVIALLIPIAYWPGGEILEQVFTPKVYFLWVVIGIPTILVLVFGINAYMNIQEDRRLEDRGDADPRTASTDGGR